MSDAKHTPTPWTLDPVSQLDIRGPDGLDVAVSLSKAMHELTIGMSTVGPVTREEAFANAAFIVRACNNFDALVAFLEKYIREDEEAIAEWERQFPTMKWGKDDRAIKNLEAARQLLKAAKGEA